MALYDYIIKETLPAFELLRKQAGFTLRQVEEKTGISNAYLSQLENRKIKNPSWFTVIKLLKLYYKWGGEGEALIETEALLKQHVSHPVCACCRDTGWYFIPYFGGGGENRRCSCGANCG